jgi:hypothetical protein
VLIGMQIIATPFSIAFLPFLFLYSVFQSPVLSYLIVIFVFFVVGICLARLLHPFYICLKYTTLIKYSNINFNGSNQFQPTNPEIENNLNKLFKKSNIALVLICSALLISSLFINISYIGSYGYFYIFDTTAYSFLSIFLGFLTYKMRFYKLCVLYSSRLSIFVIKTYKSLMKLISSGTLFVIVNAVAIDKKIIGLLTSFYQKTKIIYSSNKNC